MPLILLLNLFDVTTVENAVVGIILSSWMQNRD